MGVTRGRTALVAAPRVQTRNRNQLKINKPQSHPPSSRRQAACLLALLLLFGALAAPARADQLAANTLSDYGIIALAATSIGYGLTRDGKRERTLGKSADALLLETGVTFALKTAVNERRPTGSPHSFPSGHTAAAFALASVVAKNHPQTKWWVYVLAAGVGWSRLSLRQHHFQDVVAGTLVGLGAASVGDRGDLVLARIRF